MYCLGVILYKGIGVLHNIFTSCVVTCRKKVDP